MEIKVNWLTDWHGCETCGSSYAEGATVLFDGKQVLEMKPVADCFGGTNYSPFEVYEAILKLLGHTLDEEDAD